MISERIQRIKYLAGDFVSSSVAWFCFNCIRYNATSVVRGEYGSLLGFLSSPMVLLGQVVFPLVMMVMYYLSGYYNDVFHKSRLQEVFTTFWSCLLNALLIFFAALINDTPKGRTVNYELILILVAVLFVFVYAVRCAITNHTSHMIKTRQWSFRTLVVGRGSAAVAFVNKLNNMTRSAGYNIIGYVSIPGENDVKDVPLPCYSLDDIAQVCREHDVEELIVVPTRQNPDSVLATVNHLFSLNLPIKVTPDRFNVLLSQVRISDMYGQPLVDISGSSMSESEKNLKRVIDVIVSAVMLVLLSPLFLCVAIAIKLDSEGDVFFRQERIGYHNVPFQIIKFRTMVKDAERNDSPQLTSDNDPRVTRVGAFLRKYRIDEFPQFWNVIKGDMSIVGPRPERQYFINQIIERVPSYALLHQVRPGITSMGMVKYGYAQNVDQMVERLSYDLLYLENMTLLNDFKIMVYTIKTVITGQGM